MEFADTDRIVGSTLRSLRVEMNLSQRTIAKRLNRSQAFVSRTERGQRSLRVTEVVFYALALELTPLQLYYLLRAKIDEADGA